MQPDTIAKKIRENLVAQKERLESYLDLLDSTAEDIRDENVERLHAHISIETEIINELGQFKKVLAPLEKMYDNSGLQKDGTIDKLKTSLDHLASRVQDKSSKNRLEVEHVIANVKAKLEKAKKKNIFKSAYQVSSAGIVDVSG